MERFFLQERMKRIEEGRKPEIDKALSQLETACLTTMGQVQGLVLETLSLMKQIEYKHVGLSSEQYMLHPIRVASLALEYVDEPTERLLAVCLLHNVQEVGIMSEWLKKKIEGIEVELSLLNIDRKLCNSKEYMDRYYAKIGRSDICRATKVLDKLDNIFMICSNPDESRRSRYIKEIRDYVVPLAEGVGSGLDRFIDELATCAERLGHLESI